MENTENMGINEDTGEPVFKDKLKKFATHSLKKFGMSVTYSLGMRKSFSKIVNNLDPNVETDNMLIQRAAYWRISTGMKGSEISQDIDQIKFTPEIVNIAFDAIVEEENLDITRHNYGRDLNDVIASVHESIKHTEHKEQFDKRFLENPNGFMSALLLASGPGANSRLKEYCDLALEKLDPKKKEELVRLVQENIHDVGFNQAKYFLSKGDLFFPENDSFKKDWANGAVSLNCSWAGEAILRGNPAFALAWEEEGRKVNLHDVAISNKIRGDAVDLYPRGEDRAQVGNNVMAYASGNKMLSSMPRSIKYSERDILAMGERRFSRQDFFALKGAPLDTEREPVLAQTVFQTKEFTNRMSLKLTPEEKMELEEIQNLEDKMDKHKERFNINKISELPLTIELNREALRRNREMRLEENQENLGRIRMEIR